MYLIVGLGNPEEEYAKTRHNMGFDAINKIGQKYNIEVTKKKFKGMEYSSELQKGINEKLEEIDGIQKIHRCYM